MDLKTDSVAGKYFAAIFVVVLICCIVAMLSHSKGYKAGMASANKWNAMVYKTPLEACYKCAPNCVPAPVIVPAEE